MASAADIRSTVSKYLAAVGSGKAADVAALFAVDATLEDPVGTEPRRGRDEIREFFAVLEGAQIKTELLTLRAAADTAAFHFRVVTDTGDQTIVVEPIDIMTFDDDAQITSMRAVFSPDDVSVSNAGDN